jgi:hypothetical protein
MKSLWFTMLCLAVCRKMTAAPFVGHFVAVLN